LLLNKLNVALISKFELFEILIDFSEFISILFESSFEFDIDLFLPSFLFFFLEFFNTFCHALAGLFGGFLHVDDLLLISGIFLSKHGGQFLS
jgi:hypothetical protein